MTQDSPNDTEPRQKPKIGTRHFIGTYITSIALKASTLIQSVILARLLEPEGRGELAAIILWPTIAANIGNFGTGLATTRAAAASNNVASVARTGLLVSLLLSIITTGIGMVMLPWLIADANESTLKLAQIYMLLFVPAFIISANLSGIDQGLGNFWRLNLFRLLQSPINVLLLLVLIFLSMTDLTHCLWALILSTWIVTLGRIYLLFRDHPLWGAISSPTKLIREGFPYAVVNALGQLMHRGDQILLLWLLSARDLGLYVVAFSAASIMSNLAQSMGLVTLTIAAQEKVGEGFTRVARIFRGTLVLSCIVGLIQIVVVYHLIPLLYGEEFAESRLLSVILCLGIVMFGAASVLGQNMRGQGKPLVGIAPNIVGLTIMIVVSYLLSPELGAIGIAIGFVTAQVARTYVWSIMTVRNYKTASMSELVPTYADVEDVYKRLSKMTQNVLTKAKRILIK